MISTCHEIGPRGTATEQLGLLQRVGCTDDDTSFGLGLSSKQGTVKIESEAESRLGKDRKHLWGPLIRVSAREGRDGGGWAFVEDAH